MESVTGIQQMKQLLRTHADGVYKCDYCFKSFDRKDTFRWWQLNKSTLGKILHTLISSETTCETTPGRSRSSAASVGRPSPDPSCSPSMRSPTWSGQEWVINQENCIWNLMFREELTGENSLDIVDSSDTVCQLLMHNISREIVAMSLLPGPSWRNWLRRRRQC